MAEAQHPLSQHSTRARPASVLLRCAPVLTLALLLLPLAAGLAGTLLPAFGWLPALGGTQLGLAAWRDMLRSPGLGDAWWLGLATGWAATLISLGLALGMVAWLHHRGHARRLGWAMAPLLATPHAALAIGLAFLILPSGWLARLVSPGLSGWALPPDITTVGHASGWPLVAALVMKELPFLVLVSLGALHQVRAHASVAVARSLGYAAVQAWWAVVQPLLYRQIRLPVLAVLVHSLSVVDMAMVLGPDNPPTLAVLAVRWFSDPDPRWLFPASAAATLLLLTVLGSLLLWWVGEQLAHRWHQARLHSGVRRRHAAVASAGATALAALLLATAVAALLALLLWSFALTWRWPDAWPTDFGLATWRRQAAALAGPTLATLGIGLASTAVSLVLVIACLEHEAGVPPSRAQPLRGLAYLPLLVPQLGFLFGLQVLLVQWGADGRWATVVWVHSVFVLPYLALTLADPWRSYDARFTRSALSLGASRWRCFWRIKLPMLLPAVLWASAVAFAVSVSLYLPTLFAGAGRVATLTTEAVTLSSGADRRVIATWAWLQAMLPLALYLAAAGLPQWLFRHRRGLV